MLNFTSSQKSVVDSIRFKRWLFEIDRNNSGSIDYYWSTAAYTYDSNDYLSKVSDFSGITMSRNFTEYGMFAPNELTFKVADASSSYSASDFIGGRIVLRLVCENVSGTEEEIRSWEFTIKKAHSIYGEIVFNCETWLSKYLKGEYPNRLDLSALFPSEDSIADNYCSPVIFGHAYIPVRSVWITDQRWYILGEAGPTYIIEKIRTPENWGGNVAEWTGTFSSGDQTDKTGEDGNNYRASHFVVVDTDDDGLADENILFVEGDTFVDLPCKYYRSDTVTTINPSDVIQYVLEDMGIPSTKIDSSSFGDAYATYVSRGITFNGGYWYRRDKKEVLAELCTMCDSELVVRDKIYLYVHSNDAVDWDGAGGVVDTHSVSEGTFKVSNISVPEEDSGYVVIPSVDNPISKLFKVVVPADTTTVNPTQHEMGCQFITDTEVAQKLGHLKYQRQLLRKGTVSFSGRSTMLGVEAWDTLNINHAAYGGDYNVLLNSLTITKDLELKYSGYTFSKILNNWDDLSYVDVVPGVDSSTGTYNVVVCGPDPAGSFSGLPNYLPGLLKFGNVFSYMEIDGENKRVRSNNYVAGSSGAGFTLEPELLEVGNIRSRGTIRTSVFQKDTVSCVGGNLAVLPADTLAVDMSALDTSTLTIDGNESFAVNDILRIKEETSEEWLRVTNIASAPEYTVTRDLAGTYAVNTNPVWTKGASVVNYKQSGDGYVYMTASESNAPYIGVYTHAGSPWSTISEEVRLGNLNGYLDYTSDIYGFAAGNSTEYIKADPTNGVRMSGGLTLGTTGYVKTLGKDSYADTTSGFFLGYDSSEYKFNIGDADNYLKFDGEYIDTKFYDIKFNQIDAPATAPTAALAGVGAGTLDNANYSYKTTFVTLLGETNLSVVSNVVAITDNSTNGQISLTNIPTSANNKVVARKLYRTHGYTIFTIYWYYLATLSDNTTTTYLDNIPDSSLTTAGIFGNSTGAVILLNNENVFDVSQNNTSLGYQAGTDYNYGFEATCIGYRAGYNAAGSLAVYMGSQAGAGAITTNSVFIGAYAGIDAESDDSVFVGYSAGHSADGNYEVGVGYNACLGAYGSSIIGIGALAGYNSTNDDCIFLGYSSGAFNDGSHNICIGYNSGRYVSGNSNILIGQQVGTHLSSGTNNIYIGTYASSNTSNTTRIGNSSMTSIGGQVGWSTLSDESCKENIEPCTLGLEFVRKLNPVDFDYKDVIETHIEEASKKSEGMDVGEDKEEREVITVYKHDKRHSGFISQEVKQAADDCGAVFRGHNLAQNDDDKETLVYSEFVIPLVNAVKELSERLEVLENPIVE